ncbi:hypothetical protein [Hymenobacter sp.]|uniref:hypothetical protein n=1 Tax=Hymenobacter sp. TaxID=1898978 RepID=UPI002ED91DBC
MKKILLLILLVALIDVSARYNLVKLDGMSGEIWNVFLTEDTEYSAGYSHFAFAKVTVGMSRKEVENMLGKPLVVWKPYKYSNYRSKKHFIGYEYSRSPTSTHYRLRQVYFDRDKVVDVINYFYID